MSNMQKKIFENFREQEQEEAKKKALKNLTPEKVLETIKKAIKKDGYPVKGWYRDVYYLPWANKVFITEELFSGIELRWKRQPVWLCEIVDPETLDIDYSGSISEAYMDYLYRIIEDRLIDIKEDMGEGEQA